MKINIDCQHYRVRAHRIITSLWACRLWAGPPALSWGTEHCQPAWTTSPCRWGRYLEDRQNIKVTLHGDLHDRERKLTNNVFVARTSMVKYASVKYACEHAWISSVTKPGLICMWFAMYRDSIGTNVEAKRTDGQRRGNSVMSLSRKLLRALRRKFLTRRVLPVMRCG